MANKERFSTLLLSFVLLASAAMADESVRHRPIEVIDVPTAEVVDHYGYNVSFRFGKEGNLQTKTTFGIFPRLNLGFGFDGERVLGTESGRLNKPTLNVKFRLFQGKGAIPAFALGFDGQGYQFNRATDEYKQREKGLFLVATKEIFIPNFFINVGGNQFDFDEGNATRGFAGLSYVYEHALGFMAEYDHATMYKERRVNYGVKYFVTPLFTVDGAARNVAKIPGTSKRETERIVRLSYTGSF